MGHTHVVWIEAHNVVGTPPAGVGMSWLDAVKQSSNLHARKPGIASPLRCLVDLLTLYKPAMLICVVTTV